MKVKRIIALVLVSLMTVVLLTGCANISKAKYLGHEDITFEKAVKRNMDKIKSELEKENDGAKVTYKAEWKKGWSGEKAPDKSVLDRNEKPMTYVITLTGKEDGETHTGRIAFYMVHDTKENTLSTRGGYNEEDGDRYYMTASEAKAEIEALYIIN